MTNGTGDLASSIHAEPTARGAAIVADMPYAAYVEFGTGLGPASAEPLDQQAMSESGYVVNGTRKGESGWVFPSKDGTWKFTHGQRGVGYMAQAGEEMRRQGASVTMREFVTSARTARRAK